MDIRHFQAPCRDSGEWTEYNLAPRLLVAQNRLILTVLFATAFFASSANAELIVNGGFETGDTTGWIVTNLEPPFSRVSVYNPNLGFIHPHSGNYYASLSNDRYAGTIPGFGKFAEFSQNVGTVAGQNYNLSFWAYIEPSALPGVEFRAYWNNSLLLDILDPKDNLGAPQDVRDKWVKSNFVVTGSMTGADTVKFFGFNDPRYNGLDDVSLNPVGTPLPGNLTMCAIAAAMGLCAWGWSHRKAGAVHAAMTP
jgi:hypothetical protein